MLRYGIVGTVVPTVHGSAYLTYDLVKTCVPFLIGTKYKYPNFFFLRDPCYYGGEPSKAKMTVRFSRSSAS